MRRLPLLPLLRLALLTGVLPVLVASTARAQTCTSGDDTGLRSGQDISVDHTGAANSEQGFGQSFFVTCDGVIRAVEVYVDAVTAGPVAGTLEIAEDGGTGAVLLSTPFAYEGPGWYRVELPRAVPVASGGSYRFFLSPPAVGSGFVGGTNDGGAYGDGSGFVGTSLGDIFAPGIDFLFTVDLEPPVPSPALCTGVDLEQRVGPNAFANHINDGARVQGVGQAFVAPCDGVLRAVEVYVSSVDAGPVTGTLEIATGSGPGGDVLLSAPFSYNVSGPYRVDLPALVPVAAGQSYKFFFAPPDAGSGNIGSHTNGDLYPDGDPIIGTSLATIGGLGGDLVFALDLEPRRPITVTSTADDTTAASGRCTLREAIVNANVDADRSGGDCAPGVPGVTDRIVFDIVPSDAPVPGLFVVQPTAALPALTGPVSIDGATQPGASCGADVASHTLNVILDGRQLPFDGLVLNGGGSTVRGLVVQNFGNHGIVLGGGGGHTVACSYVGTGTTGTGAVGNGGYGIEITSDGNTVGGPDPADGNVVSASVQNVHFEVSGGNLVQGNHIGTDAAGTALVGTSLVGVGSNQGVGNAIVGNVIAGASIANVELAANPAGQPGNVVRGNRIGTDATGTAALGGARGVRIASGANGNTIGGAGPADGNVISGNDTGVEILSDGATNNVVEGNRIGTDASGTAVVGNATGIRLDDASQTIVRGNTISGNTGSGLAIVNRADGTRVSGNTIGLAADGSSRLGNGMHGVLVSGSIGTQITGNTIGANDAGIRVEFTESYNTTVDGNVLVGNDGDAVQLIETSGNVVSNNVIGTDAAGTLVDGNGGAGVFVASATGITIETNTIVHGGGGGVVVDDTGRPPISASVTLRANQIDRNGGLGIDLGGDGVTPNDDGDADEGPNGLRNTPTLTPPTYGANSVVVRGTVGGSTGTSVRVEFFASETCDPSGFGEGARYLGHEDVPIGAAGTGAFSRTLALDGFTGRVVSATATDALGNTSEFARCPAPELTIPSGYLSDVFADRLGQPEGLAVDAAGVTYVSLAADGAIRRFGADGLPVGPDPLVSEMMRPVSLALLGDALFVSDLDADAIFRFDLSSVPGGGYEVEDATLVAAELNGPTNLRIGPDGALYASVVRGAVGEKVLRIDLASGAVSDVVVFPDAVNVNPQGLAFAPNGDLYVALQFPGEVLRVPAGAARPVDAATLAPVFGGLDNPGALDFGPDGRLYVATRFGVQAAQLGTATPVDFVTGLGGSTFNGLVFDGVTARIADGALGRVLLVTVPKRQVVDAMPLTYTLLADGLASITDGSDLAAMRAGFAAWENVAGSDAAFVDGGTTTDPFAGIDGVNKVTVDPTFPFPPLVLAIAAKTIVLGDDLDEGEITDADVVINPEFVGSARYPIGTPSQPGAFDLQSIVTHEVGHVLGLVHSGVTDATMYFVLQPGDGARTLTIDDEAWASFRYPAAGGPGTGSIAGRIIDGTTGDPVAGALVLATDTTTGAAVHAYSDENGDYLVPRLPFGTYRVGVEPLNGVLRPANVSTYLLTVANNLTFQPEFLSAPESDDPAADEPDAFAPVTVGGAVTGANIVTNRDVTPPAVAAVSPRAGAADVATDAEILVTFTEAVVPSTLVLTLSTGGTDVPGTTTLGGGGTFALFTPDAPLANSTPYVVRVAAGLSDASGNLLAADVTSGFTTEPPDVTAPGVALAAPVAGATGVLTTQDVTLLFTEAMDPATLTAPGTIAVTDAVAGLPVPGTLSVDPGNTVATFTPGDRFAETTSYAVTVAPTATDLSGNAIAPFSDTFTTGADVVGIAVVGPADGATNVPVTTAVLADFTAPIDPAQLSTATFGLRDASDASVPGTFERVNDDTRVVFRPSAPLAGGAAYTVVVPADAGSFDGLLDAGQPGATATFTTATIPTTPIVLAITPPSAAPRTTVVLVGEGFDPNPANVGVTFDGVPATVSASNLTSVTATVPAGATSGPVVVTVGGQASNAFFFEIAEPVAVTDEVVARVSSDVGTRGIDVSPDGTLAFATNAAGNSVSVIDVATATIEPDRIFVGDTPLKVAFGTDGTKAYVTNFASSTVSVIDVATRAVTETIPVGLNPIGIAVAPDGATAYVAEFTGRAVSVIDVDPGSGAENRVVARLSTDSGNRDVAVTPDGGLIIATGTGGVTVLNAAPGTPPDEQVVARIATDTGTNEVAVSPDGTYGFATTVEGAILVIDLDVDGATPYQVVARTSTDVGAKSVEVSPDGGSIFAANFDDGTVITFAFTATLGAAPAGVTASVDAAPAGDAADAPAPARTDDPAVGIVIALTPVDTFAVGTNPEEIVFAPAAGLAVVANSGSPDEAVTIVRFGTPPPPAPEERIGALLDDVQALVDARVLNRGQGRALSTHLEHAQRDLERFRERNRTRDLDRTIRQLDLFARKTDLFMQVGTLSLPAGDPLRTEALAVILALEGTARKQALADGEAGDLPDAFALAPNYPNPFATATTLGFDVPADGADLRVRIHVYDVLGRRVAVLVDAVVPPGRHTTAWDLGGPSGALASGVYLVRMQAGDFVQVRKVVLTR